MGMCGAGPVVAAACFVPPDVNISGIQDSKKVREMLLVAKQEEQTPSETALVTKQVVLATTVGSNSSSSSSARPMFVILSLALPGTWRSRPLYKEKYRSGTCSSRWLPTAAAIIPLFYSTSFFSPPDVVLSAAAHRRLRRVDYS